MGCQFTTGLTPGETRLTRGSPRITTLRRRCHRACRTQKLLFNNPSKMANARLSRALPPPRINTITSRSPRGTRALTRRATRRRIPAGRDVAQRFSAPAYTIPAIDDCWVSTLVGLAVRPTIRRLHLHGNGAPRGDSRNHYFRSPLSVVRAAGEWTHANWELVRLAAARGAAWREFLSFGTDGIKRATPTLSLFVVSPNDSPSFSPGRENSVPARIYVSSNLRIVPNGFAEL